VTDWIVKPFDADMLLDKIHRMLDEPSQTEMDAETEEELIVRPRAQRGSGLAASWTDGNRPKTRAVSE